MALSEGHARCRKSETGPCAQISQKVWCANARREPNANAIKGLEPDDRNRFGRARLPSLNGEERRTKRRHPPTHQRRNSPTEEFKRELRWRTVARFRSGSGLVGFDLVATDNGRWLLHGHSAHGRSGHQVSVTHFVTLPST